MCLSLCTSPSLPTSRLAWAVTSDLSYSCDALPDDGDAVWCSFLLGLILVEGRKGNTCWFGLIIMHIVCHLCWFSWCFEVSLALVLCLRQNCLLLHCSCYFSCFYVHFYFVALLCQFGYNCMKLGFRFYPVTFSYRIHPLPCRKSCVNERHWANLVVTELPINRKGIFLIWFLKM